ncbi:MAG TPA: MFS transporter [Steroidobacteraceae bacterium]|nr:MFS transporter [Steroidobacteraceae bacterium]
MSAAASPSGFPPPPAKIPWLGLFAVLMGTFISTLNGRLSTFGLNDIRGAVHAGFDEGAWITTAQTVAQMLILPAAVWMGAAYGPRRVLLWAALAFAVTSLLAPFSTGLPMLLTLQFAGGLASGFFVPLTLSFILLNTPPKYWAFGIALYALNLELSLNIAASLEGWYVEHLSWRWIFWQNVPLALLMSVGLRYGVAAKPPNSPRPAPDVYGLIIGGVGLALIYAGLDQGNRLDWLNSGLVWGLLLAGLVLVAGFLLHESRSPHPFLNIKVAFAPPIPVLLVLVGFLRLTILATAYLIPLYLGAVRGFRALEVGQTLLWIAAPQLLLCPIAALMLRRSDPRLVASIGFIFISVACLMVAYSLTPLWGSDQFLPSQLLQAVGQSFALSGAVFFAVLHLRPQDALTFGAAIQIARLMGGQIGQAFIVTLARVRGQVASNLIGLHVQSGDGQVTQRLQAYANATANAGDPASGATRAATILGNVVRSVATTQAVIDCFVVIGGMTSIALLLLVIHKAAPTGPASAPPFFVPRGARSTKPS